MIAVCVSGIARPGYKKAIKRLNEVFNFDTFFMQWKEYDKPDVDNCFFFDEPQTNYHCLLDTKYKPNCSILKRYCKNKTGKIFVKDGLFEKSKNWYKQLLAHYWLVKKIDAKYKTIIKIRYDTLLSLSEYNKDAFLKLLDLSIKNNIVIGIAGSSPGKDIDEPIRIHKRGDCMRCHGSYLFDHIIIHPRWKMQNVEKLWIEKNLMGAEWGAYQILNYQWGDDNYLNVEGGNILLAHQSN